MWTVRRSPSRRGTPRYAHPHCQAARGSLRKIDRVYSSRFGERSDGDWVAQDPRGPEPAAKREGKRKKKPKPKPKPKDDAPPKE